MGPDSRHSTPIAISDVTGGVGGRVARRLAELAQCARLIVLDGSHDTNLPEMAMVEASYGDPASLRRALDGVHTFFMIPVHEAPDRVERHASAVEAAVAAGVERIVYSSFVGAASDATFTFARDHWHTEEQLPLFSASTSSFCGAAVLAMLVPSYIIVGVGLRDRLGGWDRPRCTRPRDARRGRRPCRRGEGQVYDRRTYGPHEPSQFRDCGLLRRYGRNITSTGD